MFNRIIWAICCCAIVGLPDSILADSVVHVPGLVNGAARFVSQKPPAATNKNAMEFTANGDGACLVTNGAAVVTALAESKFQFVPGPTTTANPLVLEQGGFQFIAGSKPSEITLGKTSLVVADAEIWIYQQAQTWFVRVMALFSDKKVKLSTTYLPPVSTAPAEQPKPTKSKTALVSPPVAPVEPLVKELALTQGQTVAIHLSDNRVESLAGEQSSFNELRSRLTPLSTDEPLLTPVDVEDANDLIAAKVNKEEAFEDVEIEEIEIEAGCVEICID